MGRDLQEVIGRSRSTDGGKTWEAHRVVWAIWETSKGCGNSPIKQPF
jgi:hypothetical protein